MLASTAQRARTVAVTTFFFALLAAASARADLSGTWKLDESQSDDPSDAIQDAGEQRRGIGRILRGTMESVVISGVPIPVGQPRSDEPRERPRIDNITHIMPDHLLQEAAKLSITQDSRFVDFTYDDWPTITYENGDEHKTRDSIVVPTWTADRIVIKHAVVGGGEITETFALDGARLRWEVRVEKKGFKTLKLNRVYDRAEASTQLRFTAAR